LTRGSVNRNDGRAAKIRSEGGILSCGSLIKSRQRHSSPDSREPGALERVHLF
jgi:hypothetical protein